MLVDPNPTTPDPATRRLDALIDAFRRYGWIALFVTICVVLGRAESADLTLETFRDRVVSKATAEGVDIGARTQLFATSVALFAVLFPAVLLLAAWLRRVFSSETFKVLEALSIAGVALWLARAFTFDTTVALDLVIALGCAFLVIGILDSRIFRRAAHSEASAYAFALGLAAFGCAIVRSDFGKRPTAEDPLWDPWFVFQAAVVLHVLVRLLAWRRDETKSALALSALAPALLVFAWIPWVSLLRNECYLVLNNNGYTGTLPRTIHQALLVALGAWLLFGVVRRFRDQRIHSLAGPLESRALPLLAFGITSIGFYYPLQEWPIDLFEPANAGLFVQQLFDFGRLPFIETFNAHGLADSFWSFVYRALHGPEEVVGQYEFVNRALGSVLIYAALRRVTGNAYLAIFVALLAPFRTDVFPSYCELALATYFVLAWYLARPDFVRSIALAFYCAFVFLWRLDMGAATLLATAFTLVGTWITTPSFRPRLLHLCGAGAICGAFFAAMLFLLAALRDVDALRLLLRLKHVIGSSQGFGIAVARTFDPTVYWHLAVMPLLVLSIVILALLSTRVRALTQVRPEVRLFVLFAAGYYFANYQRGLVRHTFWEIGNVYLLSFGFAVILASIYGVPNLSSKSRAVAFLAVGSLLVGCFGLQGDLPERSDRYETAFSRAEKHRRFSWHVDYVTWRIDRSPYSKSLERRHYGAVLEFVANSLKDDQTFLDLTSSPMLYAMAKRRSPHYLNHLFLAHDQWLQKDAAQEFRRHDIPFVFAWMDPQLSQLDRVEANHHNSGDSIHNSVRQWIFYEWLHRHYEPWRLVQRWETWRRKDWVSPVPPGGSDDREILAAKPQPDSPTIVLARAPQAQLFLTNPERAPYLRFRGSTPVDTRIQVTISFVDGAADSTALSRELVLPAGERDSYWTLPYDAVWRPMRSITIVAPRGVVDDVALRDVIASDFTSMPKLLTEEICPSLGKVAWLWANADSDGALSRPVLRQLTVSPSQSPGAKGPRAGDTRMFFGKLEEPFDPVYVHLRLNRTDPNVKDSGIVWGRDERSIGRMNFDLHGEGPQDYLLRISGQFSWAVGQCNWLMVVLPESGVTVESAQIRKGD